MKSPFPGMDPYLEQHWEDVHTRLIAYVADELQPQLAEDLIARMEEKVYVEDDTELRMRKPDVHVFEMPTPWQPTASTAVLAGPMKLQPITDPIRRRSVLIFDSAGNRIVTAIEVLSPWNKRRGKDVRAYLDKRKKYIESDVNLIEIDLVRAGDWTEMIGGYDLPDEAMTTYRVTVSTAEDPWIFHYPIPLQSRLPTIEVPLRLQDAPAKLNLQQLVERAYTMGRYDRIDYGKPCKPPLAGVERDWAEQVVNSATPGSNENH